MTSSGILDASRRGRTTPTLGLARVWRAQTPLAGHLSPITAIACGPGPSPEIFTGGYDGHVLRWSRNLTDVVWQCRFPDLVNAIAIHPGGLRLAVSVADGYVYIVGAGDGRELARLGPHGDDVNDASWRPGHLELAVVCDADCSEVTIWNFEGPLPIARSLFGHEHGVFAIDYAPAGDRFATASEDGTVRVWEHDAEAMSLPHPGDVETLAWAPDGDTLATGCDDGALRLWGKRGETLSATLEDARASVRNVGFSHDGCRIFAASYDGTLRVYDRQSLTLICELATTLQWERAAAFDGDDAIIVGSFGSRPVRHRLDHDEGDVTHQRSRGSDIHAPARTWGVNTLTGTPDGGKFAATDCGIVVDVDTTRVVHETDTLICCLAPLSHTGYLMAIGDYLGRVTLLRRDGAAELLTRCDGGPVNAVADLGDGTLATGGYDGHIRRWTIDGELVCDVKAHAGPIKSLAWSGDAQALVAGSSDDTASVWSFGETARETTRLEMDDLVLVNAVRAFPNSSWIAIASRDCHLRLWDLDSGALRVLPAVHTKSVKTVAAGYDGPVPFIASGSYDGTLCIWHLDDSFNCQSYTQLAFHGKPGVSSVLVGGGDVTSAGWDGVVAVWDASGRLREVLDVESVADAPSRGGTLYQTGDVDHLHNGGS
jgi:WD40 repeat protein